MAIYPKRQQITSSESFDCNRLLGDYLSNLPWLREHAHFRKPVLADARVKRPIPLSFRWVKSDWSDRSGPLGEVTQAKELTSIDNHYQ